MWTSLLLLWSIPIVIGAVMLGRMADGNPTLTKKESRLLFRDGDGSEEMSLSALMALKFALFAAVYFGIGVLQGLVFVNLGTFWAAAVPLLASMGAMLLLAYWVRSGARQHRLHKAATHPRNSRRLASFFSR